MGVDCELSTNRALLSEIEVLNLSGDGKSYIFFSKNITSLKAGDFSGLSSLKHLDLTKNQLTSLPKGIFSGFSSLEYLYLERNKFVSLPEGIFDPLISLKKINPTLSDRLGM